ncbi:MAG TPA: hypothetical protein VG708_03230 [Mycobacteriales bacterium]|nr:hypothetical protein [Mycobacteriales bacterium]
MPRRSRTAALTLASGVAVASLVSGLLPALAAPSQHQHPATAARHQSPAAVAAATYLVRQLHGKQADHYVVKAGSQTFPDYGETADAVLSLDAAGVEQAAARRMTGWLRSHAQDYAGTAPNFYPGSLAKLLLVAEAQHARVHHFGGINLIAALQAAEGAGDGTAPGQYQNPGDTQFGSNVLVQSLAVIALAKHGGSATPDSAAVDFLGGQQCSDGAFQVSVRTDPSAACESSSDDVDTTGYAIQALVAAGDHAQAVRAVHWLRQVQHKSGGWGETADAASDANSTAIAIEGLLAAHRKVGGAVRWLERHQLGCGVRHPSRRGAVLLNGTKYDAATAVRATSQAGVPLAHQSLASVDGAGATRGAAAPAGCAKRAHSK